MFPTIALASAVVSWFVAFVGYFGAIGNTTGRRPAIELLFNGFQLFVSENFTETGLKWRSVHFAGFVGFAASLAVAGMTAP